MVPDEPTMTPLYIPLLLLSWDAFASGVLAHALHVAEGPGSLFFFLQPMATEMQMANVRQAAERIIFFIMLHFLKCSDLYILIMQT